MSLTDHTDVPPAITPATVRHLAELARIDLTVEEIEDFTVQLSSIVASVAKVSEVATPDVPPTSHPIPLQNIFRDDTVEETLTIEQALSGAPESAKNRFKVSAILDDEEVIEEV